LGNRVLRKINENEAGEITGGWRDSILEGFDKRVMRTI
jgi:hypothetical protein